jgi:hypothetical protein
MRRKAEILKYSSARMSTQTNSMTKKQKFAGLVKGSIPSQTTQCYDITKRTPTSACDVPGPVMYLYNDPQIPLYNYTTGNRSYAFVSPNPTEKWRAITQRNTVFNADSSGVSFYLQITRLIDQSEYTYDASIPIGVSISTSITADMSNNSQMTINITDIRISVLYNGILVNSEYYSTPVSDISMKVNVTGASGETLSIQQYIGTGLFPEITLYTEYGYVYTVYMQATVSAYMGDAEDNPPDITLKTAKLISNMSLTNINDKCVVKQIIPEPETNIGFVFVEVT